MNNPFPTGTNCALRAKQAPIARPMQNEHDTARRLLNLPLEAARSPTPAMAAIMAITVFATRSPRRDLPSQAACHAVNNPFPTRTNRTLDAAGHQLHGQC